MRSFSVRIPRDVFFYIKSRSLLLRCRKQHSVPPCKRQIASVTLPDAINLRTKIRSTISHRAPHASSSRSSPLAPFSAPYRLSPQPSYPAVTQSFPFLLLSYISASARASMVSTVSSGRISVMPMDMVAWSGWPA